MIGMRTILEVADNSGARKLQCSLPRGGDLGLTAGLGDVKFPGCNAIDDDDHKTWYAFVLESYEDLHRVRVGVMQRNGDAG